MKYIVTSIIIGDAESPSKLKMDALKDIKEAEESSGGEANDITIDDIVLHRIVVKCFLQVLFGKSCKIFLENVASPNWRKLQSLDWQLSCQPHSHCRPNLVVTA